MILTPQQINSLLEIIENNQSTIIGREFGLDFLSDSDKLILEKFGVDLDQLYSPYTDTIFTSFHFGMLSDALQQLGKIDQIKYDDLVQYIKRGDYIPLTYSEKQVINTIKTQSLASLRATGNRIFQDINNIIIDKSREGQEEFLKQEIADGVAKKRTVRQIANDIARKTGDWSRDFDRIIQYTSQAAFESGKAAALQREFGDDVYVYKTVFPGACKHCIRLYLTKGLGSEPKVFKLSQLITNGSNIGRKVADWLPTLDPLHPYCRCALQYLSAGDQFKWDIEKKKFEVQSDVKSTSRPRPKIKAIVGGVEVYV